MNQNEMYLYINYGASRRMYNKYINELNQHMVKFSTMFLNSGKYTTMLSGLRLGQKLYWKEVTYLNEGLHQTKEVLVKRRFRRNLSDKYYEYHFELADDKVFSTILILTKREPVYKKNDDGEMVYTYDTDVGLYDRKSVNAYITGQGFSYMSNQTFMKHLPVIYLTKTNKLRENSPFRLNRLSISKSTHYTYSWFKKLTKITGKAFSIILKNEFIRFDKSENPISEKNKAIFAHIEKLQRSKGFHY